MISSHSTGKIKETTQNNLPFYLFMFIVLVEYLGLGQHYTIVNDIHLPWILSAVLIVYIIMKYNHAEFIKFTQFRIFLIFLVWTFAAMFFALIKYNVYVMLTVQIAYFLIFIIAYYMFLDMGSIKKFLYVIFIVHAILIFDNLDVLLSPTRTGHLRAGYFLGDGNDFAWSLVSFLPFSIFMIKEVKSTVSRVFIIALGITIVFGIVATGSRGAALALLSSFAFLAFQGTGRFIRLTLLIISAILILSFAPNQYADRISTIKNYESDSSAIHRIVAWKAAVQMAIDYPLGVGQGNFPSVYGRFYAKDYGNELWRAQNRWIAPHSIYFLVLAEYGFIGLGMLLYLIISNMLTNRRTRGLSSRAHEKEKETICNFSNACSSSMVAFSVGGIFLGGLNYPTLYFLTAMTLATNAMVKKELVPHKKISVVDHRNSMAVATS